ncbi:hypothetical protein FB451DRAFT_1176968 [Mycena latifolia]|nr:hypothetical protein FB451DRAFT_1176968 [Mycena latifolia]
MSPKYFWGTEMAGPITGLSFSPAVWLLGSHAGQSPRFYKARLLQGLSLLEVSTPLIPTSIPIEPAELIDGLNGKYDKLVNSKACGRVESIAGLGEFRATLFGSICQTVTCVPSNWRQSPSNCLKLCCPDWSNIGWSARYFEEYFNEQCSALHLLAYQGTRSLVQMGSRADVEWVNPEGNIKVFLKPLTTVFHEMEGQIVPLPCVPNLHLLELNSVVVIDATFHCAPVCQPGRLFSIEAVNIQVIHGKDVTRPCVHSDDMIPDLDYPEPSSP